MSFFAARLFGQIYDRTPICAQDTVYVDYESIKSGRRIQYKAFECGKVSRVGIRLDMGFNYYKYNPKTRNWLGNHGGLLLGFAIAYGDFNIGAKIKLASVNPKQDLEFNGDVLTNKATLNPVKADYEFSYSLNFKHNFSIEPYFALTTNSFIVINEEELGKNYQIDKVCGLTLGTMLNKYFPLKNFQFFSIFARYGYGMTNFRSVNPSLGVGYSDFSIGIAYKGFIKHKILKRI